MIPFKNFPLNVQEVLLELEKRDQKERENSVDRSKRLRQIPRETGEFLFLNVLQLSNSKSNPIQGLEIGSSGGYSSIYQGMALKLSNKPEGKLISVEIDPIKIKLAKNNFKRAGLLENIQLINSDAKEFCKNQIKVNKKYDFFFLDAEKEDYLEYYEYIKKLASNKSLLFADNVISHQTALNSFIDQVRKDSNNFSLVVPIGKGILKAYII